MKKAKKHQLTVEVNTKDVTATLARIAAGLGFLAKGGPGAGSRGAVGQLFQAVADGRAVITLVEDSAQ